MSIPEDDLAELNVGIVRLIDAINKELWWDALLKSQTITAKLQYYERLAAGAEIPSTKP